MTNLAVFCPVIAIAALTPVVQQIDGPEATGEAFLALEFSPTGAAPATHRGGHMNGATNEQKAVLVNAEVPGLWIGTTNGGLPSFLAAAGELGLQRIVEE